MFKKANLTLVMLATFSFMNAAGAEDESSAILSPRAKSFASASDVINELNQQFKSARQGEAIKTAEIRREWECEFHHIEQANDSSRGAEKYFLNLKEKLSKKDLAREAQKETSTGQLTLEADAIHHHDKENSKTELRLGRRHVISGKASERPLDEMAHDEDLDTVDEIAVFSDGANPVLLIKRSYFYKGHFKEFSTENQNPDEWTKRNENKAPSKLLVPRAYSICIPAI